MAIAALAESERTITPVPTAVVSECATSLCTRDFTALYLPELSSIRGEVPRMILAVHDVVLGVSNSLVAQGISFIRNFD